MGVSKNWGTPKSSILIGFSIINHPFWGFSPYLWKHLNVSYIFFGGEGHPQQFNLQSGLDEKSQALEIADRQFFGTVPVGITETC